MEKVKEKSAVLPYLFGLLGGVVAVVAIRSIVTTPQADPRLLWLPHVTSSKAEIDAKLRRTQEAYEKATERGAIQSKAQAEKFLNEPFFSPEIQATFADMQLKQEPQKD